MVGKVVTRANTEEISQRLRKAIKAGELSAGGRLLPERDLCAHFDVGRYGLRQVLDRLEAEGIIWRRQGQGTFISSIHPPLPQAFLEEAAETSPAEMMEVRIEFEPIMARLCALRASREQIQDIRQKAEFVARADDAHGFENADFAFHRSIATGTNNILLLAMYDLATATLRRADWRVARQNTFSKSRRSDVFAEHESIIVALEDRDPIAAEAAMRSHLQSVYEHLQRRQQ